jgi:hypothetical protein
VSAEPGPDLPLEAYLWRRFAELFASSGIADAVQASASVRRADDGTLTLFVRSRSRGTVAIGTIGAVERVVGTASVDDALLVAYLKHERDARAAMFEPMRALAEELDEKRQAPLDAIRAKKRAQMAKAVELHAAGRSVPFIARTLGVWPRTVQRYLREAKSATDRDLPS